MSSAATTSSLDIQWPSPWDISPSSNVSLCQSSKFLMKIFSHDFRFRFSPPVHPVALGLIPCSSMWCHIPPPRKVNIYLSTTRNLANDNFTSGVIIQLMYCWLTMSPRASGECRLYKTCQLPKCELILDPQVGVPHAGAQRHLEEGRSSQPPRQPLLVAGVQVLIQLLWAIAFPLRQYILHILLWHFSFQIFFETKTSGPLPNRYSLPLPRWSNGWKQL